MGETEKERIEYLESRMLIDKFSRKSAKMASRWNIIPVFGGQLTMNRMLLNDKMLAAELGTLFNLSHEEISALSNFSVERKTIGKQIKFFLASSIPDLGLLTKPAVEDLAGYITRFTGWVYYFVIKEGKLGYHFKKSKIPFWSRYELSELTQDDLMRIFGRAKREASR